MLDARAPAIEPDFVHETESNPGVWVERQCAELGVSVWRVAREAKIDRTTLYRWKTGQTRPYWDSFQKVRSVIDGFWTEKHRREPK